MQEKKIVYRKVFEEVSVITYYILYELMLIKIII